MSRFLEPLKIEEIDGDDRRWRLLERCEYDIGTTGSGVRVVAEAGFVTDFGSIPRSLWGLPGLSPFGKYRRAYVIHDWLYQHETKLVYVNDPTHPRWIPALVTRREADGILREAIGVLGGGWWDRFKIWSGVRLGGWRPWGAARAAEASSDEPDAA